MRASIMVVPVSQSNGQTKAKIKIKTCVKWSPCGMSEHCKKTHARHPSKPSLDPTFVVPLKNNVNNLNRSQFSLVFLLLSCGKRLRAIDLQCVFVCVFGFVGVVGQTLWKPNRTKKWNGIEWTTAIVCIISSRATCVHILMYSLHCSSIAFCLSNRWIGIVAEKERDTTHLVL